jgi:hypothetical protein
MPFSVDMTKGDGGGAGKGIRLLEDQVSEPAAEGIHVPHHDHAPGFHQMAVRQRVTRVADVQFSRAPRHRLSGVTPKYQER